MAKGKRGGRTAFKSGQKLTLSAEEKKKITEGIENHTSSQNNRAENFYKTNIAKEEKIVLSVNDYIKIGHIKSAKDEWFQHHVERYNLLKAQYSYFKKERKRLGK